MWLIVMFDLPTDTRDARQSYAAFRKQLLQDGFYQVQYSVYARPCPSRENATVHVNRVERSLPPAGEVRILKITDKQFERMGIFCGKKRTKQGVTPGQLQLF